MKVNNYHRNHYVPQWYQTFFLPRKGEHKFFYLDLNPDAIKITKGRTYKRNSIMKWGTPKCFFQEDLYTTKFAHFNSTEIEQKFFGSVEINGLESVKYFNNFEHPNWDPDKFTNIINYMSIQKLRTPKGLLNLQNLVGIKDKNTTLFKLQELKNIFCATWSECIWQIASAKNSPTKFIISDHPVTLYNRRCYLGSKYCRSYFDPDIRMNGTHTIFPLSQDNVLILTNLSWVRNPFGNPLTLRPNPTYFRDTFLDMRKVQTNRNLTEKEVMEINYIIKSRAFRYIASAEKDWLYPEKFLKRRDWYSLGDGYLLMPDPRSVCFGRNIMLGNKNNLYEAYDEYGRMPGQDNYSDENLANREWNNFLAAQGFFALKYGPKRRGRSFEFDDLEPEEDSPEMHESNLKNINLLSSKRNRFQS